MIGQKLYVLAVGLLNHLVGLSAPFIVPIALLFTPREARNLAWAWYDTPDEPNLYDLFEPGVHAVYARFGHWVAAWYWFGWRNRAHGFAALFARPWTRDHVDPGGEGWWEGDGMFMLRRQWGFVQFVFGWQAYRSVQFNTGFEARPVLSVKFRWSISA